MNLGGGDNPIIQMYMTDNWPPSLFNREIHDRSKKHFGQSNCMLYWQLFRRAPIIEGTRSAWEDARVYMCSISERDFYYITDGDFLQFRSPLRFSHSSVLHSI
jgi:hypothetical protein